MFSENKIWKYWKDRRKKQLSTISLPRDNTVKCFSVFTFSPCAFYEYVCVCVCTITELIL